MRPHKMIRALQSALASFRDVSGGREQGQGQDPASVPSVSASTSASGLEDGAMVIDVVIPDLGSDEGADLVELLVPVGGQVEEGDSLVLLESDKASMEVPAPAAGTVTEWLIETGTTVKEGAVIARLAIDGALAASPPVRWWHEVRRK